MQRGSRGALHPQGRVATPAAPSSFVHTLPLISPLCKQTQLHWGGGCEILSLCTPNCSISPCSAACPRAALRAESCLCTQLSRQQLSHRTRPCNSPHPDEQCSMAGRGMRLIHPLLTAGTGDGEVPELREQHFQGNPAAVASSEHVYSPATAPGSRGRAGASPAPGAAARGEQLGLLAEATRCQHPRGQEQSTQHTARTVMPCSTQLEEQSQNRPRGSALGRALVPVSRRHHVQ